MERFRYLILPSLLALWPLVLKADLEKAFPSFNYQGDKAVPIDILEANYTYRFNPSTRVARGFAKLRFEVNEAGYPLFDLIPAPENVQLEGSASTASLVQSPDGETQFRVVHTKVIPGKEYILEMQWDLSSRVSFSTSGVRIGFFMGDLSDRNFFEKYGPTNLEFDQFQSVIELEIENESREYVLYTNGTYFRLGPSKWIIQFPDYFTTSSYFLHLVPEGSYSEARFYLDLKSKTIPVILYSASSNFVAEARSRVIRYFEELENTFGEYGHPSFVAYLTSEGGGMEYCGATMTELGALGHELTHSWFARGVMPASGNSAWIDEAIASWRDNGYPRYSSPPNRQNLGNFSKYRRYTTTNAYSGGMRFIGHLDYLFRDFGGMKEILSQLWLVHKKQTITNAQFQEFLENELGASLENLFNRHVFNQGFREENPLWVIEKNSHPTPYTEEALLRLQ